MTRFAHAPELAVREVSRDNWCDFERLFDARGGPKNCWCMAWRSIEQGARNANAAVRKAAMAGRIEAGGKVGLLGYVGDKPVAWCSVAPRSSYKRLVSNGSSDEGVWSIVCFFVARPHRGVGLAQVMLGEAVEYARSHGARVIEAYPVEAHSPSYRFMGYLPMFLGAGFQKIGREGTRRHIVQRVLTAERARDE